MCEWRSAGLVLRDTQNCIAAVKERVALHKRNCFGRDNQETLSELFGSFFTKVGDASKALQSRLVF